MWPYLSIILVGTFFSLWLCVTRKRDVIETHETNARMIGILVVTGLLCVWLALYGLGLLTRKLDPGRGSWSRALNLLLVLPSVMAIYSYIGLERFFKSKCGLDRMCFMKSTDTRWPALIEHLSDKLGLVDSPKVAIMSGPWRSPLVFGRSKKRALLALPSGFEEMLDCASRGRSEVTEGLAEFILLHELAHIKNRDVVFASWLECFLRTFRYMAAILILYLLLEGMLLADSMLARPTLVILVVCYLTLLLLARSFRQYRELLADARAGLCMDQDRISRILEAKEDGGISPFESAVIMYSVSAAYSPHNTSGSKREPLRGAMRWIVATFHGMEMFVKRVTCVISPPPVRKIERRIAALRTQQYVSVQTSLPTIRAAFWNGLVGGLVFLLSMLLVTVMESYAYVPASQYYFRKSAEIVGVWGALGAFFYVPCVYLLPLRNSGAMTIGTGSYLRGLSFRYFVGAIPLMVLFIVLNIVSPASRYRPSQYLVCMAICLGFFALAFVWSCLLTLLLVSSEHFAYFYRRKELSVFFQFLPGLACTGCLIFVLVWLIGWFVTILSVSVGLLPYFLSRTYPITGHPVDRWIKFDFPVLRRFFDKRIFEGHVLRIITLFILVIWPLPIGVAALAFSNLFSLTNARVFGRLEDELLYVALFVPFSTFIFASYREAKRMSRTTTDVLRLGYLLSASLRILGARPRTGDCEATRRVLSTAESEDGGFSSTIDKALVNMGDTWTGLACLSAIGLEAMYKDAHAAWIFRCGNVDGGFGVLPGSRSRLSATFYALSSLSTLNSLEAVDSEKHALWIERWKTQEGGFHGPHSGWEPLTDTFFAVGSLRLLGQIESINCERCAIWALNDWRKGSPTHERTYYLAKILDWLGHLSKEWADEIDTKYLRPYAPVMTQLRIEKHPGLTFYYLSCAEVVKGLHYIEQEMGRFANRVTVSFSSFVQYSAERLTRDSSKGTGVF